MSKSKSFGPGLKELLNGKTVHSTYGVREPHLLGDRVGDGALEALAALRVGDLPLEPLRRPPNQGGRRGCPCRSSACRRLRAAAHPLRRDWSRPSRRPSPPARSARSPRSRSPPRQSERKDDRTRGIRSRTELAKLPHPHGHYFTCNSAPVHRRSESGIKVVPTERSPLMNLGLRALLLIAAVILFVFAAISDSNFGDLLVWGLACLAARFSSARPASPASEAGARGPRATPRPVMLYAGT